MKKRLAILFSILLAAATLAVYGQDRQGQSAVEPKEKTAAKEKEKPAKTRGEQISSLVMKKKLESAQQILEALSKEDFESMASHAKDLGNLGILENWLHADSPDYKAQLNIYRFATGELVRLAEDKNLDGASLAYVQLTLSCVNCHKYVRKQKE